MDISKKGIDLIKSFEGCRLEAYDDKQPKVKITSIDQVEGTLTIGWGHTGSDVKVGMKITQAQADALFLKDLKPRINAVNSLVKVDLTQNQYDALVDFVYNAGVGSLKNSTLLKFLNMKHFTDAAKEFLKWNKSKGEVLYGLTRRRTAEMNMFLNK